MGTNSPNLVTDPGFESNSGTTQTSSDWSTWSNANDNIISKTAEGENSLRFLS